VLGRRIPFALGTPVAAAVLITVLLVPAVWGAMRSLDFVRSDLVLAPGIAEREKCLVDGGRGWTVAVSRWLKTRMPPQSRFALSGPLPRVCLQLNQLPRKIVGFDEPRQFTVYADPPEAIRELLKAERGVDPAQRKTERFVSEGRTVVLVREG
jgi:hypothetical protein